MNRADCNTCDHKKHPEGGHCYMFKNEPQDTCMAHTAVAPLIHRSLSSKSTLILSALMATALTTSVTSTTFSLGETAPNTPEQKKRPLNQNYLKLRRKRF